MKKSDRSKSKTNIDTRKKVFQFLKEYSILIFTVFIITSSIIQGSRVPTGSMETTVMIGDWVMTNKLAYELTTPRNIPFTDIELPHAKLFQWGNPERNDIVVFEFPGNRDMIKNPTIENVQKELNALGEEG